jgi:hypothetical protein
MRTNFLIFIISVCIAQSLYAQEGQPKPRKYKTTYEVEMYQGADFHSKKIGKVPDGVIVVPIAESTPGKPGGYLQLQYKNKIGWVMKAELERYMDVPAAEMVCFSNGYKIIRGVYRYFLACRNDGVLPYSSSLTLRLYDNQDKISFEKTVSFSDAPIQPGAGGPFYLDSANEAPRFEITHQGGTIKGGTGALIERIP